MYQATWEGFDHEEFFRKPDPEPNIVFSDDDPPVFLPPDDEEGGAVQMSQAAAETRSWQTEQPSVEILDEINDMIAPYADTIVVSICDTGENPHQIIDKPLYHESHVPGQSAFDGNSHGTHVGGTIAGNNRRFTRFVGFQHGVEKVLSNGGSGQSSWILNGINHAREWRGSDGLQVSILNMSLGGNQRHEPTIKALYACIEAGIIPAIAAGNSGNRGVGWPAADPNLPAIAARDENRNIAAFSSRGEVLIADAGVNIMSASNQNQTLMRLMSGTSMATPNWGNLMGGVLCLHRASGAPNWRNIRPVFNLMKDYGIDLGKPGYDRDSGYGYPDIEKLLTDMAQKGPRLLRSYQF